MSHHTNAPVHIAAPRPLVGVGWMLLTGFFFVGVTAVVKYVGASLPAAQGAFLRYSLGLMFFLPMAPRLLRLRPSPLAWRLFALRGAMQTLGVILWFYAMARIPIAEVTALGYLAPVYVTFGAALFLGERLALRRIVAVLVALFGALVILRPGFHQLSGGQIAMLGTALFFGASYLAAKRLSDEQSPLAIVAMLSLAVTIGLAPFAAAVWITPSWAQVGWMALVAVFATLGHLSMTKAFAAAPISLTQPVGFLQLVWATLLGWLAFGEPPDGWVMTGGAIIIAAVSYIAWREAHLARAPLTPDALAEEL